MTDQITETTQRRAARIAGFWYLIIIIAGVVAEFVVRSRLIVAGDAAATARNIMDSESLFRLSLAGDLVMIGADMIVAVALYVVLRPINQHLALLAAAFRLVMDAILGVNLLNLVVALMLLDGSIAPGVFSTEQLQAAALTLIDAHAVGYSIALVPFGFGTLLIGYLLFTSRYVPRAVGALLSLAALVYLSGSFVHILAPDFEETFSLVYVVPFVAELTLALWLTFKGVNTRRGTSRASSPVNAPASNAALPSARRLETR